MVVVTLAIIGASTAAGLLAGHIAREATKATHPTYQEAKKIPYFEEARKYGEQMSEAEIYGYTDPETNKQVFKPRGLHEQAFYSFVPGSDIARTGAVGKYAGEYLKSKGATARDIEIAKKAIEVERNIGGIWDIAGAIAPSAAAEMIGSKATATLLSRQLSKQSAKQVSKAIAKESLKLQAAKAAGRKALQGFSKKQLTEMAARRIAARQLTKATIPALTGAGAYEGAVQSAGMQLSRTGEIDPVEVGKMAAFGAASAGLFGTAIARTSITRPRVGKAGLTAARIADPYEYPGDVLGGAALKATKAKQVYVKIPGQKVKVPTAVLSVGVPATTEQYSASQRTKTKRVSQKVRIPGTSQTTTVSVSIPVPVPTQTPTGAPTPTTVPVPAPTETPTQTPTETPTETPTQTPTQTPTETPTETPTQTPTVTVTPTPTVVPTPTPIGRVYPPIPMAPFGPAGRGQGVSRGRDVQFYNEAAAARAAVAALL